MFFFLIFIMKFSIELKCFGIKNFSEYHRFSIRDKNKRNERHHRAENDGI